MTVNKVWVNPAHGTEASRRALRAAGNELEAATFRRARPRQLRKPKAYNIGGVGKNDPWAANLETPVVPEYRGRKANYRSGTASVGKRYSGASTGTGGPKKVQPTRVAGRKTPGAGITMRDESKPPIDPSLIGKGAFGELTRNGRIARSLPKGQQKEWKRAYRGHLKAGSVLRHERGNLALAATGNVAGRVAGRRIGEAAARSSHPMLRRIRNVERAGDWGETIGGNVGQLPGLVRMHSNASGAARRAVLGKRDRAYNPEHNRQRRLGIATAATGIGGAASLGAGGVAVHNASRHVDAGRSSLKVKAKQPGTKKEAREVMEALADREKNGLMLVSRRTRGKLGLGAGLLGTSAGLHHYSRGRSNREWR